VAITTELQKPRKLTVSSCLPVLIKVSGCLPISLTYTGPGRRHKSDVGDGGERPSITFADVAGVDEAKEELYELVVSGRDVEGEQQGWRRAIIVCCVVNRVVMSINGELSL
jgi:hypothetical protein